MDEKPDCPPLQDPEGPLERALIEAYLREQGHSLADLDGLPEAQRRQLLCGASAFAAGRMAEIEARAHYVDDIHRRE